MNKRDEYIQEFWSTDVRIRAKITFKMLKQRNVLIVQLYFNGYSIFNED